MKKLTLLIAAFFSIASAFAQITGAGEDGGTHDVYTGSNYNYSVLLKQHDNGGTMEDDAYLWEVFSDAGCTAKITSGFTFDGATASTNNVGVTWNTVGTYYLRIMQTGANSCYNLKTITVNVADPADMNFAFKDSPASSSDCAVNLSGDNLELDITLSGASLVHETARPAQIFYAITTTNGTDVTGKYANVNTTAATGAGDYTFTIPAAELMLDGGNLQADGIFTITVTKLKDGAGTEKTLTTPQVYTWTAHGLPAISPITIN